MNSQLLGSSPKHVEPITGALRHEIARRDVR